MRRAEGEARFTSYFLLCNSTYRLQRTCHLLRVRGEVNLADNREPPMELAHIERTQGEYETKVHGRECDHPR